MTLPNSGEQCCFSLDLPRFDVYSDLIFDRSLVVLVASTFDISFGVIGTLWKFGSV